MVFYGKCSIKINNKLKRSPDNRIEAALDMTEAARQGCGDDLNLLSFTTAASLFPSMIRRLTASSLETALFLVNPS